jgi:predicted phosphodiesterase
MRVAALYDVHAMPWALEAVLAEVDADAIVIGGDFLYGPYPAETLRRVRALDAVVLRGNCEETPEDHDRNALTDEELAWVAALPLAAELDGVVYCHATPTDNRPITTAATSDELVEQQFGGLTGTVVIGHTHHQFDRRIGALRVVNAGAVGMPYEGDVAAFWTIVEDGEPRHMRTAIDIDEAVAGLRASDWPGREEFIAENVLVPVPRDAAIAAIEARRP